MDKAVTIRIKTTQRSFFDRFERNVADKFILFVITLLTLDNLERL